MAGRQQVGEGSSLQPDPFLLQRRSSETTSNVEDLSAAGASPSNSIAALVSNYDDLSGPSNPWQYLSTPSSPTSQRDYNYYNAHSNSLHFQRDQLVAEYPWMQEVLDQQQQRAANPESAGSKAPDVAVDSQDHCNHTTPPTRRRRREQVTSLSSCFALLYLFFFLRFQFLLKTIIM